MPPVRRGGLEGRRPKLRPNQDEIVAIVSAGTKTAADAARLFAVHPATVSRLLVRAGVGTIGVKVPIRGKTTAAQMSLIGQEFKEDLR
jgi:hypothetical protein